MNGLIKKVLIGAGIVAVVIGVAAATIFVLQQVSGDPSKNSSDTQQLPAGDPIELEQKANDIVESDPEEASELYSEAQQLYEAADEDAKASEMQDNAASTAPKSGEETQPTAPPPISAGAR